MKTVYEWSYETLDENGDIIDVDFSDRLKNNNASKICLIKRIGDEIDCEKNRWYAYIEDNRLPKYFNNSLAKVPQKYHNELQKYLQSIKSY